MNETTLYEEATPASSTKEAAGVTEREAQPFGDEPLDETNTAADAEANGTEANDFEERIRALETRCLAAESTLADSLAFATLWAPYAGAGERVEESPHYKRFMTLREKGLSVEEAFAAATYGNTRPMHDAPSKAHLFSGVPSGHAFRSQASSEEMAIARELLGEDYSPRKLEQLFRRVTKGS